MQLMTWEEEVDLLEVLHSVRQFVDPGSVEIGCLSILGSGLACHTGPSALLCSNHTISQTRRNLPDTTLCILDRE